MSERDAVVVGVSLEGHGESAVRWAAAEARDRGVHLRLVHGLVVPVGGYPGRAVIGADPHQGLLGLARRELRDMREVAHGIAPELPVDEDVVESDPVGVLRAQARVASLIVIGSDGFGLLGELAVGGIARGLVGHVDVPVVVVPRGAVARERAGEPGGVVVGDDGTTGARGALRFAAHRAAVRGAPLVVVRAGADARLLPEEIPELGGDRPSSVRVVLAEDRADRVLADQADDAELVVLGVAAPGWRQHRHARRGVVERVRCPVVIVPPDPATDRVGAGATGTTVEEASP